MKNLFNKSTKTITKLSIEKLDKTQLKQVIGGTDEADKITFKAKEGATSFSFDTNTTDIKQISTADGPRY